MWIEELGCFAITCTAYGPAGPAVYLATTTDFESVERRGIVVNPEDKNAALLPERVDGKWILFHRPTTGFGVTHPGIALSRSPDLVTWSPPEVVLKPRDGAWWDSLRIGIGPPLLKTEHGWLLIYHGVKETVGGAIYRVGLALLDLEEPTRVLRRAQDWIFAPQAPYERQGDVGNAIFPCGVLHDSASGELRLYYGAADTSICLATAQLDELLDAVLSAVTVTGTPAPIRPTSQIIAAVSSRMQPCETAVPSTPPTLFSPCSAICPGPPSNSCRTFERALSASA